MADAAVSTHSSISGPGSTPPPSRVAPRTVLLVGSFGAFLAFLDATVVNVAFPDIRASFPDSSISGLSWVLNAYNIVFASFLIVFGRLADLVGRRRVFTAGIALFTLASVWCAAAGSLDMLVVARMAQAAGAAMLVPASLAVVVEAFPADRRGHAVSLWGASAAVAAGLGPPVGGALVEIGGWRLAFLVNLPIGAVAWWVAGHALVESRAPGHRRMPDVRGALLLAASLSLLTLGIVQGDDWGWTSLAVVGSLAGAVVLGLGFVASSRAHPQPLLDPALLRIRPFATGNALTIVAGMGFYAYMLTNILWLQYVWHYEILRAGLALVPGALVAAVVGARLGPVAQAHGYRRVLVPGALVWAAAYVWYAVVVGPEPSFWAHWLPGQVLSGIGVGATLPVLGSAALAAVPGGRFATASAVVSSTRQLGGVLGIALLVVIIGTPTPLTAETVLRHGWVFCALCFAAVALGSLLLRVRPEDTVAEETDAASTKVHLHVPAQRRTPEDASAVETVRPDRNDSYLSRLPATVRVHLEHAGEEAVVAAGDWLFHAGEPAEAMYVVLTGRLEVLAGDTVLRELGRRGDPGRARAADRRSSFRVGAGASRHPRPAGLPRRVHRRARHRPGCSDGRRRCAGRGAPGAAPWRGPHQQPARGGLGRRARPLGTGVGRRGGPGRRAGAAPARAGLRRAGPRRPGEGRGRPRPRGADGAVRRRRSDIAVVAVVPAPG